MRRLRLAEFCETGSGGTPSRDKFERYFANGMIPWVKSGELRGATIYDTDEKITQLAVDESSVKIVPAGALLLAMYGATVGRLAILGVPAATNQAVCHIIPDPTIVDTGYLLYSLRHALPTLLQSRVGGAQPNISQGIIQRLQVSLPPLPEQQRIAGILDKADALRAKRRAALAQLDTLTQSIFLDMFGDPARNPRKLPVRPLGSVANKFSDGPFGSNLKTEHYKESGIRVIRLQNIGAGEFLDLDRAFISPQHFDRLRKHECLPGDVLIGTLGDPNLRACVLPTSVPVALNKADCVQLRPNTRLANSQYLCALLNQSATLKLAQELMHGQTRVRISMGNLRDLNVPVPPIEVQEQFARRIAALESLRSAHHFGGAGLDALFSSLQHRAFRGEL